MSWTTFAALTGPTLPELDGNFVALAYGINIDCTAVGQNAITMTPTTGTGTYTSYQQGMTLVSVGAQTNNGAVTAGLPGLALLPVYKDTSAGPATLVGSEIVQLCNFSLVYDLALNAGGGGFHLKGAPGNLVGQTITLGGLTVTGTASLTALSLGGTLSLVSLTVSGPSALASLTVSGPTALGASLSINSGTPILRYNTLLGSLVYGSLLPQTSALASIVFSGVQLSDIISLGWSVTPPASVVFTPYVIASGTIGVTALNPISNATVSAFTVTARFLQVGFV